MDETFGRYVRVQALGIRNLSDDSLRWVIGALLFPWIRRHWQHHVKRDQKDGIS